MGFRKLNLTVLLAATIFSLASITLTTKAFAQEKKLDLCSVASLSITDKSCSPSNTKKERTTAEFLPSTVLIPTITSEEKREEPEKNQKVEFTPAIVSTPEPKAILSAEILFELVNSHRTSINLAPFEKEAKVCSVAEARREGIASEIFNNLPMHAGFWAMNLPYWATENMIYQHTEEEALNWWLNSYIHRSAIEGNYKYACGVCNGQVCNMVFTNYEPKAAVSVPKQEEVEAIQPPLAVVSNNAAASLSVPNITSVIK